MPPADGMCFAVWPIAMAVKPQPMRAMTTDSGSVVPEKLMPMPIENARPMPGAMYVIDWNTTSRSPIDPLRRRTSGVPGVSNTAISDSLPRNA